MRVLVCENSVYLTNPNIVNLYKQTMTLCVSLTWLTLTLKLFVIEIIPSNLYLYLINPSNINLDGECLG